MTVSTLRPNGTTSSSGVTVTGAASAHAALSDSSDASYVSGIEPGDLLVLSWGDLSLPTGALIKRLAGRVRWSVTGGVATPLRLAWPDPLGLALSNATSSSPQTVTWRTVDVDPLVTGDAAMDALELTITAPYVYGGNNLIRELYADVTYVTVPAATVLTPAESSTITTTNFVTTTWSTSLDADGGAQTTYQIKIFSAAQYGAGGFSPDTSTPTVDSGILTGNAASWTAGSALANDIYRSYVRIAQTVNGVTHWSAWDYNTYTVNVPAPDAPALTATEQGSAGRIELDLTTDDSPVVTDLLELQRSDDGGVSWAPLRTVDGGGVATPISGALTIWDYEAPMDIAVRYRARGLHSTGGVVGAGPWSASATATWTSATQWLKHPVTPALNLALVVHSYPDVGLAPRAGTFQSLGASRPIVVSDTPSGPSGTIAFWMNDSAEQAALDALVATGTPLLLQMRGADARPDRWLAFTSHDRADPIDKLANAESIDTLTWVEVERP